LEQLVNNLLAWWLPLFYRLHLPVLSLSSSLEDRQTGLWHNPWPPLFISSWLCITP